jgi:predicted nucleic acid-binding protein
MGQLIDRGLHSANADAVLTDDTLHQPARWRAEAVNVLWPKVGIGDLTAADAEERMPTLNRPPIVDTAIAALMPRAFTTAVDHSVSVYGALYGALAEQQDVSLVTADVRLIRQLAGNLAQAKRMVRIGDLAP